MKDVNKKLKEIRSRRIPSGHKFRLEAEEVGKLDLLKEKRLNSTDLAALPKKPRIMEDHLAGAVDQHAKRKGACPTCSVLWGYIELEYGPRHEEPRLWEDCAEIVSAIRCDDCTNQPNWPSGSIQDDDVLFQRLRWAVQRQRELP